MQRTIPFEWSDILPAEPVDERRKVAEMCCGIDVYRQCRSLILIPGRDVRVLAAGHHECSYVQSPQAITNNTSMGNRMEMSMMHKGLEVNDAYMDAYTARIGLDPERTVMFGTAANMENAVVTNTVSKNGIKVSAAVTGGIRGNGGRAGDPASFDEAQRYLQKHGTIVIIVAIEAHLTDGSMAQAVCTATQAKSSIIQELMAKSLYSEGVATGSGTDQVCIISDTGSDDLVRDCGVCSDVGSAIADCVRRSLSEALDLQTGMDPTAQCDPFVMLSRFGYGANDVHDEIRFPCTMDSLVEAEESLRKDARVAATFSATLRIADGIRLGDIPADSGLAAARRIVEGSVVEEGDIDPVTERMLSFEDTVPGYLSMILAVLLRKRALAVMGAGQ